MKRKQRKNINNPGVRNAFVNKTKPQSYEGKGC